MEGAHNDIVAGSRRGGHLLNAGLATGAVFEQAVSHVMRRTEGCNVVVVVVVVLPFFVSNRF